MTDQTEQAAALSKLAFDDLLTGLIGCVLNNRNTGPYTRALNERYRSAYTRGRAAGMREAREIVPKHYTGIRALISIRANEVDGTNQADMEKAAHPQSLPSPHGRSERDE